MSDLEIFSASFVNKQLDSLLKRARQNLKRAYSSYKKLRPMREVKGDDYRFLARYAAGLGSGGDFFDFIKLGNRVISFVLTSDSYLTSAEVLKEIENIRMKKLGRIELYNFVAELVQKYPTIKLNLFRSAATIRLSA